MYWQYIPQIPVLVILKDMHQRISLPKAAVLAWTMLVRTMKTESLSGLPCWQFNTS